jgi:hypothetical protein
VPLFRASYAYWPLVSSSQPPPAPSPPHQPCQEKNVGQKKKSFSIPNTQCPTLYIAIATLYMAIATLYIVIATLCNIVYSKCNNIFSNCNAQCPGTFPIYTRCNVMIHRGLLRNFARMVLRPPSPHLPIERGGRGGGVTHS